MERTIRPLTPRPLFVGLALLALFAGLAGTPLWDQDEAAYAGFAHTMLTTGDGRPITFLWSDIHRKPPLHFWLLAASTGLFGESLLSVRLPGALAAALSAVVLATWGAPLFGAARAQRAALVMGTALLPVLGKIALTDAPLLLAQTVAALALLHRRPVIFWAAVSVGMLIKGPPILILVIGMGIGLAVLCPDRRNLRMWWGLPLAALPLVGWGALAWQTDGGEMIRWMIDWYILRRAEGTLGHVGPPGYYLLTFALLFFPWAAFLPRGLWQTARRRDPTDRLLLAWLLGGWVLYELIPSKLPAYAAGAWPALALIIADQLDAPPDRIGLAVVGVVGVALGVGLLTLSTPAAVGVGVGVLLGVGGLLWGGWRWTGLLGPFVLAGIWWLVLPSVRPRLFVTHRVATIAAQHGRPVAFARNYRLPSLGVYLAWRDISFAEDPDPPDGTVRITDGEDPPHPDAIAIEGWIPDKGQPIRFWVVP